MYQLTTMIEGEYADTKRAGAGVGDGTDSNNTEISAGFATIGVGAVSLVAGVLLLATGHTATGWRF